MESAENAAGTEPDAVLSPPFGLAVQELEADAPGELLLSFPLRCPAGPPPSLTPAERGVAGDLLQGFTNQEIARRRRVSVRTIANQVGGLFRKLHVHSRLELALRLAPDALNPRGAVQASENFPTPATPPVRRIGQGDRD